MGLRISVDPAGFGDRISMYPKNISIDPLGLKRPLIEALVQQRELILGNNDK